MKQVPEDLTRLDDERLLELADRVAGEVQEAQEEANRIAAERHRRIGEAAAKARFDQMTPGERDALAQMIAAQGIESEEAVQVTPAEEVDE